PRGLLAKNEKKSIMTRSFLESYRRAPRLFWGSKTMSNPSTNIDRSKTSKTCFPVSEIIGLNPTLKCRVFQVRVLEVLIFCSLAASFATHLLGKTVVFRGLSGLNRVMGTGSKDPARVGDLIGGMRLSKSVKEHLKNHTIWGRWSEIVG